MKRKNFIVRSGSVVAPSAKALAHSCWRISSKISLPESKQPSVEDILVVCKDLDLIISYEEVNERVYKEHPNGDVTAYFKRGPSNPPELSTGASDFLRCATASVKAFNRASMQDHMMGEARLREAKLVRSRIREMAEEEGLL